jgi:hypothetical protein
VIFARAKGDGMKRTMLVCALFAAAAAVLAAQEASKPSPYTGTSNPPSDTSINTGDSGQTTDSKPPAGVTGYEQPAPIPATAQPTQTDGQPTGQPDQQQTTSQPAQQAAEPTISQPSPSDTPDSVDGTDAGIVIVAPTTPSQPSLAQRDGAMTDPDGDIVQPAGAAAGGVGYGATIRVRLLNTLSTAHSQTGEPFRTRVASDVIQDGQILIPAGAEIDGTVTSVSSGHVGGQGSMHLRPETVILADGSRYHLYAQLAGAPGSSVRVNEEGGVTPGSQLKKAGIEYGGAIGAGAVTGAIVGGPAGALAGTVIGAGVITAHLLISRPQATLDTGTVLLFTLNQPLHLVPAAQSGN